MRITSFLEQGRRVWIHGLGSSIPLVITIINKLRLDSKFFHFPYPDYTSAFRERFGTDKIVLNSYSHTWEGLTETWEQV